MIELPSRDPRSKERIPSNAEICMYKGKCKEVLNRMKELFSVYLRINYPISWIDFDAYSIFNLISLSTAGIINSQTPK